MTAEVVARAVHPIAALFPMLAADELASLADDISARGLLQPVVLDDGGRVLDGRNRLAACELAGVEPTFLTYEGDDPDGYALASNGQRRDQSKSQKALIAAAYIESSNLEDSQTKAAKALGVHESRVSEALVIRQYARDFGEAVLAGTQTFSKALDTARERQAAARLIESKKQRLAAAAPDLLSHVGEGRLDLDEALAALDRREEMARIELDARLTKERQEEHEQGIARANAIEAGKGAAKVIVSRFRSDVAAVVGASRLGERLVTKAMVNEVQEALGLLEEEL